MRRVVYGSIIVAAISAIGVLPGCGQGAKDGLTIARVKGVVTLDGIPLEKARVDFVPVPDSDQADSDAAESNSAKKKRKVRPSASFAITDENGEFELKYDSNRLGAVLGEHTVRIHTAFVDPEIIDLKEASREKVPREYLTGSKLSFVVDSGDNWAEFELESPKVVKR